MTVLLDLLTRVATFLGAAGGIAAAITAITNNARRRRRIAHIATMREKAPEATWQYLDNLHTYEVSQYVTRSFLGSGIRWNASAWPYLGIVVVLLDAYTGMQWRAGASLGLPKFEWQGMALMSLMSGFVGAALSMQYMRTAEWHTRVVLLMRQGHKLKNVGDRIRPNFFFSGAWLWKSLVYYWGFLCGVAGAAVVVAVSVTLVIAMDPRSKIYDFAEGFGFIAITGMVLAWFLTKLRETQMADSLRYARNRWQEEVSSAKEE